MFTEQFNKKIFAVFSIYPNDIRAELMNSNNNNNNDVNNTDLAVT